MRSSFSLSQKKNAYLYGRVKSNEKKTKNACRDYHTRQKKKEKQQLIYSLHSFSLLFSFDVMAFLYKIFCCSSSLVVIEG
jgi:hypothetical protein